MSEPRTIRVYCEGREEFVVLGKLNDVGALPTNVQIAEPGTRPGRPTGIEGVVYDLSAEIGITDTQSIALLDLDDAGMHGVVRAFCRRLRQELPGREVTDTAISERSTILHVAGGGTAILVGVGLDGDHVVAKHGIQWYAFDDYLLRLILDDRVYAATSQLREFPFEKACHKLDAVSRIMRDNGLPLDKTKRHLQMMMGITGFRPSPAMLAQRLFDAATEVGGRELAVELFRPLVDDIAAAVERLREEP